MGKARAGQGTVVGDKAMSEARHGQSSGARHGRRRGTDGRQGQGTVSRGQHTVAGEAWTVVGSEARSSGARHGWRQGTVVGGTTTLGLSLQQASRNKSEEGFSSYSRTKSTIICGMNCQRPREVRWTSDRRPQMSARCPTNMRQTSDALPLGASDGRLLDV